MTSFYQLFPISCPPLSALMPLPLVRLASPPLRGLLQQTSPDWASYSSSVALQIPQTKVIGLRILYDHVNSFHDFHCLEENIQIPCKTICKLTHFYLCNLVIFNQDQNLSVLPHRGHLTMPIDIFDGHYECVCVCVYWHLGVEARDTIKQSTTHQTASITKR